MSNCIIQSFIFEFRWLTNKPSQKYFTLKIANDQGRSWWQIIWFGSGCSLRDDNKKKKSEKMNVAEPIKAASHSWENYFLKIVIFSSAQSVNGVNSHLLFISHRTSCAVKWIKWNCAREKLGLDKCDETIVCHCRTFVRHSIKKTFVR